MARCELCSGRLIQTEFGSRCMNQSCDHSKVELKKDGYLCAKCNITMDFVRNNPYGDPIYLCANCKKEVQI